MDAETFADVAEAQKPLIEAPVLGTMTAERWDTLAQQLKDLGDAPQDFRIDHSWDNLAQ